MFKMGCSMARKILGPGAGGSNNEQVGGAGGGVGGETDKKRAGEINGRPAAQGTAAAAKSADELGDFSKLEEDPRLPLNVRQIFKITKSWKAIARTMSKTGTAMFLNLFEQNEDLFYLFDRFQHLKGKELHESMELREHAATVMATLDQSINSLSQYDNFVSYLHSIGQLHRKVPGFKRDYFWKIEQPFMKAVKQTLDERCNETIEQIYVIAIKLIIETIAEGYGREEDSVEEKRDFERAKGGGRGGDAAPVGGPSERAARGGVEGGQRQQAGQQERSNGNGRGKQQEGREQNEPAVEAEAPTNRRCPLAQAGPTTVAGTRTRGETVSERESTVCKAVRDHLARDLNGQGGGEGLAKGQEADLSESDGREEAIVVEATCQLIKSTSSWLDEHFKGQLDPDLRRLVGNLNAALMVEPGEGAEAARAAACETRAAGCRQGSSANNATRGPLTGCPRTPATDLRERNGGSLAEQAEAGRKRWHQTIGQARRRKRAAGGDLKSNLDQDRLVSSEGASDAPTLAHVLGAHSSGRVPDQGETSAVQRAANGAHIQPPANETKTTGSSSSSSCCCTDNNEVQVAGQRPAGQCAPSAWVPDNHGLAGAILGDHQPGEAARAPTTPRAAVGANLIKSSPRAPSASANLDGKWGTNEMVSRPRSWLNHKPPPPPSPLPSAELDEKQNGSSWAGGSRSKRSKLSKRQSQNNNQPTEITTATQTMQAVGDQGACTAGRRGQEVRLGSECGGQCKQNNTDLAVRCSATIEPLIIGKLGPAGRLAQEANAAHSMAQAAAAARTAALLQADELAILQRLADGQRREQTWAQDRGELGELIRMLLLINRLVRALADDEARTRRPNEQPAGAAEGKMCQGFVELAAIG